MPRQEGTEEAERRHDLYRLMSLSQKAMPALDRVGADLYADVLPTDDGSARASIPLPPPLPFASEPPGPLSWDVGPLPNPLAARSVEPGRAPAPPAAREGSRGRIAIGALAAIAAVGIGVLAGHRMAPEARASAATADALGARSLQLDVVESLRQRAQLANGGPSAPARDPAVKAPVLLPVVMIQGARPAASEASATARETSPAAEPATAPANSAAAPEPIPLNRAAVAVELATVAARASSCREAEPASPGAARVSVTFAPSGRATAASVTGIFAGTTTGRCIAKMFMEARVPAFEGAALTFHKSVVIE